MREYRAFLMEDGRWFTTIQENGTCFSYFVIASSALEAIKRLKKYLEYKRELTMKANLYSIIVQGFTMRAKPLIKHKLIKPTDFHFPCFAKPTGEFDDHGNPVVKFDNGLTLSTVYFQITE